MKPENVNPRNFDVIEILYDNGEFSIAYGVFEKKDKCIAMRWNGDGEDAGYPKLFKHPVWFIVDNRLKIIMMKSLLAEPHANNIKILKVLEGEI